MYKREFLLEANTVFSDKAGIHVMEADSIDIDSEEDLAYMSYVLSKR